MTKMNSLIPVRPTSCAIAPVMRAACSRDVTLICKAVAERVDKLSGPGSHRVRCLLRKLTLAVERRAQDDRRLGAEMLRSDALPPAPPSRRANSSASSATVRLRAPPAQTLAAIVHEAHKLLAELTSAVGRGAFCVHAAARQLCVAVDLYDQDQRRLRSESLRREFCGDCRRSEVSDLPATWRNCDAAP